MPSHGSANLLAALSEWRFKPAVKDGQPVRVVA